jgi:hypothetical protein
LLDGVSDADVSAATAKIPAHALSNFRLCQFAIGCAALCYCTGCTLAKLGQHAYDGTNLAGCTKAALKSVLVDKGLL